MAIAGRERMRLPFDRWRAGGSLLEIGPAELAMDEREAAGLGRELGLRLPAETTARLATGPTGGLPCWRSRRSVGPEFRGRPDVGSTPDPIGLVEGYLRSEVLDGRSETEIAFLTRTAILERLSAPLCDAVMEGDGDRPRSCGRWRTRPCWWTTTASTYRYHTLLRGFLRARAGGPEPEMVATLHRRASAWYRANRAYEPAVHHAFAAGDLDLAATLVGSGWGSCSTGRAAELSDDPVVGCAFRCRCARGAPHGSPCWLPGRSSASAMSPGTVHLADIAERGTFEGKPPDGTASFEAGLAMLRAAMVRRGADDALANAIRAVELEGDRRLLAGLRALAAGHRTPHGTGDQAGADAAFVDGIRAAGYARPRRASATASSGTTLS